MLYIFLIFLKRLITILTFKKKFLFQEIPKYKKHLIIYHSSFVNIILNNVSRIILLNNTFLM